MILILDIYTHWCLCFIIYLINKVHEIYLKYQPHFMDNICVLTNKVSSLQVSNIHKKSCPVGYVALDLGSGSPVIVLGADELLAVGYRLIFGSIDDSHGIKIYLSKLII